MRVIEPRQFAANKRRKIFPKLKVIAVLTVLLAATGAVYIVATQRTTAPSPHPAGQTDASTAQAEVSTPKKLKVLTGDEFKKLYNSFAYPNTQPLQEKPSITGDAAADERIQSIAENRGYKLSSVPVSNIVKTNEPGLTDDDLIQPNALIAWQDMKAAALKDGIKLQMTSAYRSIEVQRALFLRRMKNDGVYVDSVVAGYVDNLVEKLLTRVAPPGYSRHHTGYTVDLGCDGVGGESFKTTSCYAWLSKNNYENTKRFGWVPSYPDGTSLQGPEPEPWEFIWVSTYSLYE